MNVGEVFILQFWGAIIVIAFISRPVLRLQHTLLERCRESEDPDFPVTTEEVINVVRSQPPYAVPGVLVGITKQRLKLIWRRHKDTEIEQLARRFRKLAYTIIALSGLELLAFCSVIIWKTFF
jgi:hypothetical protein